MTRLGLICGVAVLALVGGERPAPDAAKPAEAPAAPQPPSPAARPVEGFTNQPGLDLFGYYMPKAEVTVGQWRLNHLHVGAVSEFDDWNAGRRSGVYAPVLLQFDDTESSKTVNELGQEAHTTIERVIPDAWRVTETEVAFVDNHPRLGRVSFQGRLDRKALERANKRHGIEEIVIVGPRSPADRAAERAGLPQDRSSDPDVVLVGRLTIGEQTFPSVAFSWFGGD